MRLLEAGEVEEPGLHREAGLCHDLDMKYISSPVPDRGLPASTREAKVVVEAMVARLNEGKALAVHCRAGIVAHRGKRSRALGLGSGDGVRSHRQGAGRQGPRHRKTTRLGRYAS